MKVTLGKYSYIHDGKLYNHSGAKTKVEIGNFCSIATNCTVVGYDHHYGWISTYPFTCHGHRGNWSGTNDIPFVDEPHDDNINRGDISIGNDVWIGYGVTLFKGIAIGDGSIIGAKSLVNKDIPPYSIFAGIPAKLIRYRFKPDDIAFLTSIKWWNWSDSVINKYLKYICSPNIDQFKTQLIADNLYKEY